MAMEARQFHIRATLGIATSLDGGGDEAGELTVPEAVPRPPWAASDYRCSTCKGRKLQLHEHLYYDSVKERWHRSCEVCRRWVAAIRRA